MPFDSPGLGFPRKKKPEDEEKTPLMQTPIMDVSAGRVGRIVQNNSEDAKDLRAAIANHYYAKLAKADNELMSPAGSFVDSIVQGAGSSAMGLMNRVMGRSEEADTISRVNQAKQGVAKERDQELTDALIGGGKNRIPYVDHVPGFVRGAAISGTQSLASAPLGPFGMAATFAASAMNEAITRKRDRGLRGAPLIEGVIADGTLEGSIMLLFNAAGRGGVDKMLAEIGSGKAASSIGAGYLAGAKAFRRDLTDELLEEGLTGHLQAVVEQLDGTAEEDMTPQSILELSRDIAGETFFMMAGATAGRTVMDSTRTRKGPVPGSLNDIKQKAGEYIGPENESTPAVPPEAQAGWVDDLLADGKPRTVEEIAQELFNQGLDPSSFKEGWAHLGRQVGNGQLESDDDGKYSRVITDDDATGDTESTEDPMPVPETKAEPKQEDVDSDKYFALNAEWDQLRVRRDEAQKANDSGAGNDAELEAIKADMAAIDAQVNAMIDAQLADREKRPMTKIEAEAATDAEAEGQETQPEPEQKPLAEMTPEEVEPIWRKLHPDVKRVPSKTEMIEQIEGADTTTGPSLDAAVEGETIDPDAMPGDMADSEPTQRILDAAATQIEVKPGAIVSIAKLRDTIGEGMDQQQFADALMELERQGVVDLVPHNDPGSLNESELAKLIPIRDGFGDMVVFRDQAQQDTQQAGLGRPGTKPGTKPDTVTPQPWAKATVEDEARWFGTEVQVAPSRRSEEAYSGKVQRVHNSGTVIEVQPDGQEGTFRVDSSRVTVKKLVDSKGPDVQTPKPQSFEELEALPKYSIYRRDGARGDTFNVRGDGKRGGGDNIFNTYQEAVEHAEFERKSDEQDAADRAKREESERQDVDREKAQVESYKGFLTGSPMNVGKIRKALEKPIRYKGNVTTRKGMVEALIAEGRKVVGEGSDKRIEAPDGNFFDARDVTATGIRYAEHLIAQAEPTTEPAPKPKIQIGEKPEFSPENFIKIAADSIQELRKSDVARVIEEAPGVPGKRAMIAYITENRPELAEEANAVFDEFMEGEVAKPGLGSGKTVVFSSQRQSGTKKEGPSLGKWFTESEKAAEHFGQGGSVSRAEIETSKFLSIKADDNPDTHDWIDIDGLNSQLTKNNVDFQFDESEFDVGEDAELWRWVDRGGKPLVKAIQKAGFDGLSIPEATGRTKSVSHLQFPENKKRIGKPTQESSDKSLGLAAAKPDTAQDIAGLLSQDRFVDSTGQEYLVNKSRSGVIVAHPIVDGKPVVNSDSAVMFAIDDNGKARNPEYRTDIASITKWENPDKPPAKQPASESGDADLKAMIKAEFDAQMAAKKPAKLKMGEGQASEPTRTKKEQDSVSRLRNAIEGVIRVSKEPENRTRRKYIDNDISTINVHAGRLGIEVPKRSTYYSQESDIELAQAVRKELDKKYPSKPSPTPKPKKTLEERKAASAKKVADLAEQLKRELDGLTSSGLNPKLATIAVKYAIAQAEDGALTFAVFAKRVWVEFSASQAEKLKPYLEMAWEVAHESGMAEDKAGDLNDYKPSENNDGKDGQGVERGLDSGDRGVRDGSGEPGADGAEGGRTSQKDGETSGVRGESGDRVPGSDGAGTKGDAGRTGGKPDRKGPKRNPDADQSELARPDDKPRPRKELAPEDRNHVIKSTDDLAVSSQKVSLERNVAAIELLKKLEDEGRNATPQEKSVLAQFTGWGGLSQAFDTAMAEWSGKPWAPERAVNWKKQWGDAHDRIKSVMTKQEWESARDTTINAHYTSKEVIPFIWKAAQRLGFRGGRVLEPGAGIGHFAGLIPSELRDSTSFSLVEMDNFSSRLLKKLYPEAEVLSGDLNDLAIKPGSAAMAIGNVPFARQIQPDSLRRYGVGLNLHNYFIARSLDGVEPGGLVAVISTNSTLDNVPDQRAFLATKGDFIGAIRLPNNAFKDNAKTDVTTDILFFRRPDGKPVDVVNMQGLATVNTKNKEGRVVQHEINSYFVDNPEMALGMHAAQGTQYKADGYALVATEGDLNQKIDAAIDKLPESIVRATADDQSGSMQEETTTAIAEGLISIVDGKPSVRIGGKWVELGGGKKIGEYPTNLFGKTGKQRAVDYVGLRDAYANLRTTMLSEDATSEQIKDGQKKLRESYDKYVSKHGYIHDQGTRNFKNDPEFYRVLSLENKKVTYDRDTKEVVTEHTLADVFTTRTLGDRTRPTHADGVNDAMSISLAYKGRIDLGYMSALMGKSEAEIESELVQSGLTFRDPASLLLATKDEYLSGNVRRKLKEAQVAAIDDPSFKTNVEELKKAQPATVGIAKTGFELGDNWLPQEVVNNFAQSLFRSRDIAVEYNKGLDRWSVEGSMRSSINLEFGTERIDASKLLQNMLNLKTTRIMDNKPTGEYDAKGREKTTPVENKKETAAARVASEKMRREFSKFVENTPAMSTMMEDRYNELRNSFVDTTYDGSHLALPGSSPTIKLRPYQKNAIWRIIQTGKVLLAHAVGAGKTYTMIGAAMELKRLGLAKRPILVVQNATLGQFSTSFMQMYPNAKVMVARKEDLQKGNRQLFMSRISSGNWDAIVMAQSSFDGLSVSVETMERFLADQLGKLDDAIMEAGGEDKKTPTVKDLVRARNTLRANLTKKIDKMKDKRKDNTLEFEDLDADALFLDEAHAYKKPFFITKLENLVGLNKEASGVGMAVQMKVGIVRQRAGGRNIILATGTPITNTLGEAWHMSSYIDPSVNTDFGVETFDGFVGAFARTESTLTQNAGGKWVPKDAITKFKNGPELMRYLRASWDIVTPDNLREHISDQADRDGGNGIPGIRDGKVQAVTVARTPQVAAFMNYLTRVYEAFQALPGKERREMSYIPAIAYGAGKAASIDIRLVVPNAPEETNGKLSEAAKNILSEYRMSTKSKGTQLVFSDVMNVGNTNTLRNFLSGEQMEMEIAEGDQRGAEAKNEAAAAETQGFVFNQIIEKLAAQGVPRDEMAIVSDYNTDVKRAILFERVNLGEVRIMFGSTPKMGIGVNVQRKIVAIHHLDMPWQPADKEQRDGRGLRYGNENSDVAIYQYAMKGTLDGAIFTATVRKAKFIWQALSGKAEGREFEDPASEATLSVEEQVAAIMDDPLIFEKMELEKEVRDLGLEKESQTDAIARAKRYRQEVVSNIEYTEKKSIPASETRQAEFAAMEDAGSFKEIHAEIDGKTVTGKEDVDKAIASIREKLTKHVNGLKDNFYRRPEGNIMNPDSRWAPQVTPVFKMGGMHVRMFIGRTPGRDAGSQENYYDVGIALPSEPTVNIYNGSAGTGNGLWNAIVRIKDDLQAYTDSHKRNVEKYQSELVEIDRRLSGDGWPHQERLDALKKRLDEVVAEMADPKRKTPISQAEQIDLSDIVAPVASEMAPLPPEATATEVPAKPGNQIDAMIAPELQQKKSMGAKVRTVRSAEDLVEDFENDTAPKAKGDNPYKLLKVESQEEWNNARRGLTGRSLMQRLKDFGKEFVKNTTRGSLPELPRTTELGDARALTREFRDADSMAIYQTRSLLARTVWPLKGWDMELFAQAVIFRDLKGREGFKPFGYDQESIDAELVRIDNDIESNPRVAAALEFRRQWWEALRSDYIEAHRKLGIDMTKKLTNDEYFRHQVLQYYMLNEGIAKGGAKQKAQVAMGRGYLQRAEGSTLAINANYIQAEFEVLTQMLADTKRANVLNETKVRYDIRDQLKNQAKSQNFEVLAGGPDVVKRINELRTERATAEGAEKAAIIAELKKIDPLYEYRKQIAMRSSMMTKAEPHLRFVSGSAFFAMVRDMAVDPNHRSRDLANNLMASINAQNQFIKNELGKQFKNWDDLIPEGYEAVTLRPGNIMFSAYTIPERLANEMMNDHAKSLPVSAKDLHEANVVGKEYTPIVVPKELAAQMDNMSQIAGEGIGKTLGNIQKGMTRKWKGFVLLGPHRFIKYNIRNLSEIDKVLALNPSAANMARLTRAMQELYAVFYDPSKLSEQARDWLEMGGASSLPLSNDIEKLRADSEFSRFMSQDGSKPGLLRPTIVKDVWNGYWTKAARVSNYRESVLRYSAYLAYLEQIQKNGRPNNYGGSNHNEIKGISDPKRRAYRLSADLLGDYGDLSVTGQFLRDGPIPFWSFQEVNFRAYWNGIYNLAHNEETAIKAGKSIARRLGIQAVTKSPVLAYKAGRVYLLVTGAQMALNAWNALMFPDEEEELPDEVRKRPHIIFGRRSDGSIIYFDRLGTSTDILDWFGLDTFDQDVRDILDGKKTYEEFAKNIPYSAGNKLVQGLSPWFKIPSGLLTGKDLFPEMANPRTIRDKGEFVSKAFGVDQEYRWATRMPTRGLGDTAWRNVAYIAEAGSGDYYAILDRKYKWSEKNGSGGRGSFESPKTDAMRYYKQAIRFKDEAAAERYRAEYFALGGTEQGFKKSLEYLHPLSGLNIAREFKFLGTLTPDEMERIDKAEKFAYEKMMTPEQAESVKEHRQKRLRDGIAKVVVNAERPNPKTNSDYDNAITKYEEEQSEIAAWLESNLELPNVKSALREVVRSDRFKTTVDPKIPEFDLKVDKTYGNYTRKVKDLRVKSAAAKKWRAKLAQ